MNDKKLTLADRAYQRIEEMIVTLELQPGTAFSEGDLCAKLNIGRTPIREALQRLATERLVGAMPRRGMIVTEINIAEHLALLETRRVLDRLIASRAAKRASEEQRRQLSCCADDIITAAANHNLAEFMRIDRSCDQILEEAARNIFAVRACAPLHAHCRRFWYRFRENGDLTESATLHAAVMQTVSAGDETEAAIASDRLIAYLEKFTRATLDHY